MNLVWKLHWRKPGHRLNVYCQQWIRTSKGREPHHLSSVISSLRTHMYWVHREHHPPRAPSPGSLRGAPPGPQHVAASEPGQERVSLSGFTWTLLSIQLEFQAWASIPGPSRPALSQQCWGAACTSILLQPSYREHIKLWVYLTIGWFHGFRENAEICFSYHNILFFRTDGRRKKYPTLVHSLKWPTYAKIHIFNDVPHQNKRNVYFVTYGEENKSS